jgi:hypothetical protein
MNDLIRKGVNEWYDKGRLEWMTWQGKVWMNDMIREGVNEWHDKGE